MATPEYDERLWFRHRGCEGLHFVLGNPHTFPGRILGWCEAKSRSFFFSKNEIEESSPEAAAWVEGFLAGSEPPPPRSQDGDVEFKGAEYEKWLLRMESFRRSGSLQEENGSEGV